MHYCRLPVVQLVYHNGIAFAPDADHAATWQQTDAWRDSVAVMLTGKGYTVIEGMAALPQGYTLTDGSWLAKRNPEQ